jgi:hypothetical protein
MSLEEGKFTQSARSGLLSKVIQNILIMYKTIAIYLKAQLARIIEIKEKSYDQTK